MPTISMFYGIIVRMYYAPKERPPPHFHVYYGEHHATISIEDCEIRDGRFRPASESWCWHGRNCIVTPCWQTGGC